MWLLYAKNARAQESPEPDALDTSFLDGLSNGDTIYYYLYVPWSTPIDSLFIFVRDTDWNRNEYSFYHASDLNFGRWNELKNGISNTCQPGYDDGAFGIPLIQSDFEIHTNSAVNPPVCTLYWDAPSSKGGVPLEYTDTAGQAGIYMPEPGESSVTVAKTSINCIEYSLGVGVPVMIQVFDLTGKKKKEMPIGFQTSGSYSIPLDLSPSVYFARITTTDENVGKGKIICVE
jgi:hypothetical protein